MQSPMNLSQKQIALSNLTRNQRRERKRMLDNRAALKKLCGALQDTDELQRASVRTLNSGKTEVTIVFRRPGPLPNAIPL